MFIVDLGFGEYLEFETLEQAISFCNEVAKETKIILSIEQRGEKKWNN